MTRPKEKINEKKAELLKLTFAFSKKFLNDEYEKVIEKLINKMARKREVPFLTGRIDIWAAAVIHALGTVNFLFDKSSQPYISVTDIYDYFGTNQSTTSQRSKKIRDMFKMTYFDSDFSIESVGQNSPYNNLSLVNGMIVPNDMVKEQHVDVEEWEIQAAQILGIKLEKGKQYEVNYLYNLLHVNEASLMMFYDVLLQHLTFPCTVIYEEEVSQTEIAGYEVNCIHLNREIKVDETYGILVDCKLESNKVTLPLASMILDENHHNFKLIDCYLNWFWNYR